MVLNLIIMVIPDLIKKMKYKKKIVLKNYNDKRDFYLLRI